MAGDEKDVQAPAPTLPRPGIPAKPASRAGKGEGPTDAAAPTLSVVDVKLPDSVFGQTPNMAVMHQAFVRQAANARQGTAATKTRATVHGGDEDALAGAGRRLQAVPPEGHRPRPPRLEP